MKNKLYTKSYFIKRLIEAGLFVKKLLDYKNDIRKWTIVVDPDNTNIVITCFKHQNNEFYFSLQKQDVNMRLYTKSMEIVITTLKDLLIDETNKP